MKIIKIKNIGEVKKYIGKKIYYVQYNGRIRVFYIKRVRFNFEQSGLEVDFLIARDRGNEEDYFFAPEEIVKEKPDFTEDFEDFSTFDKTLAEVSACELKRSYKDTEKADDIKEAKALFKKHNILIIYRDDIKLK